MTTSVKIAAASPRTMASEVEHHCLRSYAGKAPLAALYLPDQTLAEMVACSPGIERFPPLLSSRYSSSWPCSRAPLRPWPSPGDAELRGASARGLAELRHAPSRRSQLRPSAPRRGSVRVGREEEGQRAPGRVDPGRHAASPDSPPRGPARPPDPPVSSSGSASRDSPSPQRERKFYKNILSGDFTPQI